MLIYVNYVTHIHLHILKLLTEKDLHLFIFQKKKISVLYSASRSLISLEFWNQAELRIWAKKQNSFGLWYYIRQYYRLKTFIKPTIILQIFCCASAVIIKTADQCSQCLMSRYSDSPSLTNSKEESCSVVYSLYFLSLLFEQKELVSNQIMMLEKQIIISVPQKQPFHHRFIFCCLEYSYKNSDSN